MHLLVTGGLGFIGSNFIRHILQHRPDWTVINLDKETYAATPNNNIDFRNNPQYSFVRGDICDFDVVSKILRNDSLDVIMHFAGETHVDKSIDDVEELKRLEFTKTNVIGTQTLLEAVTAHHRLVKNGQAKKRIDRFIHMSTDEVYGDLMTGNSIFGYYRKKTASSETDKLDAKIGNFYAITKETADKTAQTYATAPHNLPIIIIRSSNNYGPWQYPEKLLPLAITNAEEGKNILLYGDGGQIRDWVHVEDTCEALLAVIEKGKVPEIYNVGGTWQYGKERREYTNREIAEMITKLMGNDLSIIKHVQDRAHHDRLYAIDWSKLHAHTGWEPRIPFPMGLERTITWCKQNRVWWEYIKSGKFKEWYRMQYQQRGIKK